MHLRSHAVVITWKVDAHIERDDLKANNDGTDQIYFWNTSGQWQEKKGESESRCASEGVKSVHIFSIEELADLQLCHVPTSDTIHIKKDQMNGEIYIPEEKTQKES